MKRPISLLLNNLSYVSKTLAGATAFYLFSNPIGRAKQKAEELEQTQQSIKSELLIDNTKIATYRWGNGSKPILFAHGWNSRGSRCSKFIGELLQLGYSVISFDAQGHGASGGRTTNITEYSKIVEALYQQHGEFEAIISHSFGTACVFNAVREGVQTKALISFNGVCDFNYVVEHFCEQFSLKPHFYDYIRNKTEAVFWEKYGRQNVWQELSANHRVETIKARILIVVDEHDTVVLPTEATKLKAAYGGQATLLHTQFLGHNRALKDPKIINQVIDFLIEK